MARGNPTSAEEEEQLLNARAVRNLTESPPEKENQDPSWLTFPHKTQLFLLSLTRLSSPLSNACILPYLYALVQSTLSTSSDTPTPQSISRLTGLLVAAFPLGQVLTSMLWGRLSDTYGRKPIICAGLSITIIANVAFGFSRSFAALMFWRAVAGMANGTLGAMRSMAADLGGRKHQSRAFLAPQVVFNSGRVVALAVGGCLADPVRHLPGLFGPQGVFNVSRQEEGVRWLTTYPYALPSLFNAGTLLVCLCAATIWMRESHSGRRSRVSVIEKVKGLVSRVLLRRSTTEYSLVDLSDPEKPPIQNQMLKSNLSFRKIWTPHLLHTLLAFTLLPLHNTSFLHIFPILLSMPSSSSSHIPRQLLKFTGGLGLSPPTIGLFLATLGILGILLQLFTFPRLHSRIGTLGISRLANGIFPFIYVFAPFLALLAGRGALMWVGLTVVLGTQVFARTMAIPSSVMLLTDAAPEKSVLGTVHGAGNTVSALAGAVGPVMAGVIMARGIEVGIGGLVWWVWMGGIAWVAFGWSLVLRRKVEVDGGGA